MKLVALSIRSNLEPQRADVPYTSIFCGTEHALLTTYDFNESLMKVQTLTVMSESMSEPEQPTPIRVSNVQRAQWRQKCRQILADHISRFSRDHALEIRLTMVQSPT